MFLIIILLAVSYISSWITELGELDSTFKRADISRLKAFLSKQTDTIRLPYDRSASQFGRRTSFCASVNPESFLVDNTGARRFLPVQVLACDSTHNIDMQQLWAQVWQLYLAGEQWWCTKELEEALEERHKRHSEINSLHELITEIFDTSKVDTGHTQRDFDARHYTLTRILRDCEVKEPKKHQLQIAKEYLQNLGFIKVHSAGTDGYWIVKRPVKYSM